MNENLHIVCQPENENVGTNKTAQLKLLS